MRPELITSDDVADAELPFSPALRVGDWIFLSGQGGFTSDGQIAGQTIEDQTEATLLNIEKLLKAAGSGLADVVSVLVHLADLDLFQRYNAVYERSFPEPRPVRTTVGACLLSGMLVEITVVARRCEGPHTDRRSTPE